jgi:molecular chaperone DnaK (HSP70)
MELSDLAVRTAFGTFYPEQLSQEVLDRLKKNEMPAAEEELKRAVAEKLIKQIFR